MPLLLGLTFKYFPAPEYVLGVSVRDKNPGDVEPETTSPPLTYKVNPEPSTPAVNPLSLYSAKLSDDSTST